MWLWVAAIVAAVEGNTDGGVGRVGTVYLRHHTLHLSGKGGPGSPGTSTPRPWRLQRKGEPQGPPLGVIAGADRHQGLFLEALSHHSGLNHSVCPWVLTLKGRVHAGTRGALSEYLRSVNSDKAADPPASIGDYIPHDSFIVHGPPTIQFWRELLCFPSAVHAAPLHPAYKAHPDLLAVGSEPGSDGLWVHVAANAVSGGYQGLDDVLVAWKIALRRAVRGAGAAPIPPHVQWVGHRGASLRHSRVAVVTGLPSATAVRAAAVWLAGDPRVVAVESRLRPRLKNRFSKDIIQSDTPQRASIWSRKITGRGEIVAVSDTGIDADACWFVDPNRPVPYDTTDPSHRKIVYYKRVKDGSDYRGGHGSHVVGSLLGDALYPSDYNTQASAAKYNGMAPGAKVAFFDYHSAAKGFAVPDNMYDGYYRPAYEDAGARLMSNSWGTEPGGYDSMSQELDSFLWDYKDYLAVMAAGNYGMQGYGSLSSPGNAKNCLTIGASRSSVPGFHFWGAENIGLKVAVGGADATHVQVKDMPNYHRLFAESPFVSDRTVVAPSDPCGDTYQCPTGAGCVVLIGGCGDAACGVTDRLRAARRAGAAMAIMRECGGNDARQYVDTAATNSFLLGAGVLTTGDYGRVLAGVHGDGAEASGPYASNARNIESVLPPFSSKGPTSDGRVKPDVLAPGEFTQSVASDGDLGSNNCGQTQRMHGTSMATPIAAGGAALVRQYFRDGYYPTGRPESRDSIESPSAALLKAAIINGAAPMDPRVSYYIDHESYLASNVPSYIQGFGRMRLETTLYFDDDDMANTTYTTRSPEAARTHRGSLFVTEEPAGLSDEQESIYCLRAEAPVGGGGVEGYTIKATLVWTDPPASAASGRKLVNNLDLLVEDVSGSRAFVGNHPRATGAMGPGGASPRMYDEVNNVEQVAYTLHVPGGSSKLVALRVRGTRVPKGPQPFAVVVSARGIAKGRPEAEFQGEPGATLSSPGGATLHPVPAGDCAGGVVACPGGCSGHGACEPHAGVCACDTGFFGADCNTTATPISLVGSDGTAPGEARITLETVAPEQWRFYSLDVEEGAVGGFAGIYKPKNAMMTVHLQRTSVYGDPDLYISAGGAFPTRVEHDLQDITCDSCGKTMTPLEMRGLRATRYTFGVFASCCNHVSYTLSIRVGNFTTDNPPPATPTPLLSAGQWGAVAASAFIVAVLAALGAAWWLRRRTRASQPAVGGVVGGGAAYGPVRADEAIDLPMPRSMLRSLASGIESKQQARAQRPPRRVRAVKNRLEMVALGGSANRPRSHQPAAADSSPSAAAEGPSALPPAPPSEAKRQAKRDAMALAGAVEIGVAEAELGGADGDGDALDDEDQVAEIISRYYTEDRSDGEPLSGGGDDAYFDADVDVVDDDEALGVGRAG